jgi:glycogen debranching enzyme
VSDLGPLSEVLCVRGTAFAMSSPTGDMVPGGDQGYYGRDTRFLNRLALLVDGHPPIHLASVSTGGDSALFHACLAPSDPGEADPSVAVVRQRVVDGGLRDRLTFHNAGERAVTLTVSVTVGTDFASVQDVKHGRLLPQATSTAGAGSIELRRDTDRVSVTLTDAHAAGDTLTATVAVPGRGAAVVLLEARTSLTHELERLHAQEDAEDAAARRAARASGTRRVRAPGGTGVASRATTRTTVDCSDGRLRRLVDRSLRDLASLDQRDPEAPSDRYAAAGSPWFLTLFGRDAIWTAFMALPFDPELARGTLRTLARRQGVRDDPVTQEQPGRIVHEVRFGTAASRGGLPERAYGSIDATPLFVVLAHEAWRWGLAEDELTALMPHVDAALAWMREHGDVDGDGFLEYAHHGDDDPRALQLTHQGWKDSGDGVRYADGAVADPPVALAEVQAYAYAAAVRGAELLDHAGWPGGDGWRRWATELRHRFRAAFWVEDALGPYPAIALDEHKQPVDGPASNMGHLLMTDLLEPSEVARVAQRLTHPSLASGWGLRTLATTSGGFNPLSYHCGSVWPHDTAIAAWGLARTGRTHEALTLIRGLVDAAPWFDYRLPELFAGFAAEDTVTPVPYPAACRPQAWASASTLLIVRSLLVAEADVPGGTLTLRPLAPLPCARIALTGLHVGGGTIDVTVDEGAVSVQVHDTAVSVAIEAGR